MQRDASKKRDLQTPKTVPTAMIEVTVSISQDKDQSMCDDIQKYVSGVTLREVVDLVFGSDFVSKFYFTLLNKHLPLDMDTKLLKNTHLDGSSVYDL